MLQQRSVSGFVPGSYRLDGTGGQEDELDDVSRGILDPPTDDERPGSLDESNGQGGRLESDDEDDALIREEEAFRRNVGRLPN